MANTGEVGRIYIRVVPDLKGFRQKVEAEAKKAAKSASGNQIKFKAKVDAKSEARQAAAQASGNDVRFGTKLNKKQLKKDAALAAVAASTHNVKFGIEIDRKGLKGLSRSISTGFNSVDMMNKSDVIGRVHANLAALHRSLVRIRRMSSDMALTILKGFNGFGRPLKYAYSAVQKLGRGMANLWDRSELAGLYRQDLVEYFQHLDGKARRAFTNIRGNAKGALDSVRGQLNKIGDSDAWAKFGRGAEKAARHLRNINVRPLIPTKDRFSKAQIRLMQMRVELDTTAAQNKLKTFTKDQTANIKVNSKDVDTATSKLVRLKRTVDRTAGAKNIVGDSIGLKAAYGAFKGWNRVQRVMGFVAKWAGIAGLAITALAPPLTVLGGAVGMAALGAIGGAAAALAVVGNLGLGALFVGMAARSEAVKSAWSDTKKSMADTFDSANKPVENSLISLAPKVADAFASMQPNIANVSEGVATLLDRFGTTLPLLAGSLGKTMEQIFEAGRPGMEKLIDRLPAIVSGIGNMFEVIGKSESIKRIWDGFLDGLPGTLVSLGNGFDNAATGAGKLWDWFKSPGLSEFREGFSDLWADLKEVDWTKAREGVEDMLNSFGKIAGDTDIQKAVDGIGKISTAISGLLDAFNDLGLKGTIGVGILGGIAAGVARELAGALVGFGAKWLIGKIFGTTADIVSEGVGVLTDVAGGILGGLGEGFFGGLAEGFGRAVADSIVDFFKKDDKTKVNLEIESVTWPGGTSGPSGPFLITKYRLPIGPGLDPTGPFQVTEVKWPEDIGGLSGKFEISEITWPGDLENLAGKFEVTEVIWPGDLDNLTGTFEITNVVFPEGMSTLSDSLTQLITPLEQVNSLFAQISANATALTAILTQVTASILVFTSTGLMMAAALAQVAGSLQAVNTGLMNLQALLPTLPVALMLFTSALLLVGAAIMSASTFVMMLFTGLTNLYNTLANLIPQGVMTFIAALTLIPGAIAGFVSSLMSTDGGFSFFDGGLLGNKSSLSDLGGALSGIAGNISSFVGDLMGAGSGFSFFDGGLLGNIGSIDGFKSALGTVATAMGEMVSAVTSGVAEAVSVISTLPSQAVGVLSGLGGTLFSSGQALVQGFVNGIRSMIGAVAAAASELAGAVRAHMPQSPAKKGPLSGRGYTSFSGEALARDFGKGISNNRHYAADAASDMAGGVQKAIEDYQKNINSMHDVKLTQPIMEANAKKIADFRKREAEAHEKGNADLGKLAEDRQKMLDSLEHPDLRDINASFRSYYIDGTKEMMQKGLLQQARDVGFTNQIRNAAMQAIGTVRTEIGDHPILAGVEANVNADHFAWAVEQAIDESGIGYLPIELGIANLEQFKSDLGFGDGVISRGLTAALDFNPNDSDAHRYDDRPKEEIHYHVSDMEEAIRLENERRSRQSLRFY